MDPIIEDYRPYYSDHDGSCITIRKASANQEWGVQRSLRSQQLKPASPDGTAVKDLLKQNFLS